MQSLQHVKHVQSLVSLTLQYLLSYPTLNIQAECIEFITPFRSLRLAVQASLSVIWLLAARVGVGNKFVVLQFQNINRCILHQTKNEPVEMVSEDGGGMTWDTTEFDTSAPKHHERSPPKMFSWQRQKPPGSITAGNFLQLLSVALVFECEMSTPINAWDMENGHQIYGRVLVGPGILDLPSKEMENVVRYGYYGLQGSCMEGIQLLRMRIY